jgi:hypothetical protein
MHLLEVYNPDEYRNYIRLGKMDYLYDKVETYDKLKDIIQGKFCLMDCRSFKRDERYRASYVTFFDNHDETAIMRAQNLQELLKKENH